MNAEQKLKKEKLLKKIQQFTLMDDDYMTRFFDGEIECVQEVLRVLLERKDLKVTAAKGQEGIKNLKGRSVRLDVFARDSKGKPYDIEVQRADKGAGAKRARYNSALMDADELLPGDDTEKLPETYVIFITENDIYKEGLALYKIDRYINGTKAFNDGAHIIYVNGQYRGNDPIGDLMHDFSCSKADDMKNSVLANRARYLKEDTKGVSQMCKIMEDFAKEEITEAKMKLALENLEKGLISEKENLEKGLISENQISALYSLTQKQVAKVLEVYHSKVAVQA